MKYGEHLKANIAPEYGAENYIQYDKMDKIIAELSETKPARCVSRLSLSCGARVIPLSWSTHSMCFITHLVLSPEPSKRTVSCP